MRALIYNAPIFLRNNKTEAGLKISRLLVALFAINEGGAQATAAALAATLASRATSEREPERQIDEQR